MKPPPAFQMYAADWLSSTSISLMTANEERGYHRLLLHEWADDNCSLPADPKLLKRLALVRRDDELATILKQFEPHPVMADRIINRKLYEQRLELDAFRAERVVSGKKGADARWGNSPDPDNGPGKGSANDSANSSGSGSGYGSKVALHSSSSSFSNTPPLPSTGEPPRAKKKREPFVPPIVEEVRAYAVEIGAKHADPDEFHEYWTEENWTDGRGRKTKDWRTRFRRRERMGKFQPIRSSRFGWEINPDVRVGKGAPGPPDESIDLVSEDEEQFARERLEAGESRENIRREILERRTAAR